jgi:hypothetical protein
MDGSYKLLYIYMFCECNHAGIWDVELDVAGLRLGYEYNEGECLDALKMHVQKLTDTKWYLTDFVQFQYGQLSPDNRAHKSVIQIMESYSLKPLHKPLTRPLQGCKDKDKDKDKDIVNLKDKYKGARKRIGKLFNRKETTEWSNPEKSKLRELWPIPPEDFDLIERYYTSECKYLRRDVKTLLNNWAGELDRARDYLEKQKPKNTSAVGEHGF